MSQIAPVPVPVSATAPAPASAPVPAQKTTHTAGDAASGAEPELRWRRWRTWYFRAVAVLLLLVGLWEWSVALGLTSLAGKGFFDLRGPVRNAFGAFAVADLVAAIGLWLGANWGPVLLVVDVVISVVLHTAYADTHGAAPMASALWLAVIAGVIVLSLMVRRETHQRDARRRRLRKEARAKV